ncbi:MULTISPECIES: AciT family ciprofloxacin tolerance protein [unclassified Psychrobacter]|uniref:AciT family ciprofloxacin tolerance protein n=1 Tax=unclassified Psychrobacter TaxID=196806 RepID=UPI003FD38FBD
MMLLTIFSFDALSINSTTILGLSLLAGLVVVLALSSQRWLLWYLLGGMGYWLTVEAISGLVSSWFVLTEWHSYVLAMGISWVPLGLWVLYRAIRYEDVSTALQEQRELKAARYVEHSPVYDDDYTPRFQ